MTLDKIPERNFKPKKVESNDDSKAILSQSKSMKLSVVDMDFLKEYRTLEDLEREKGIKFFECIGDPPATNEFKDGVQVKRQNYITEVEKQMRRDDIGRFTASCNADKVIVPTKVEISQGPKWDVYENNHFAMRKRLVSIFLKVANKQIIRMRAGKRLEKIKNRFADAGITNREDAKRLVADDWKAALNMRIGGDDDGENIQNVRFEFAFNKKTIS